MGSFDRRKMKKDKNALGKKTKIWRYRLEISLIPDVHYKMFMPSSDLFISN